jgi:hypothetical protein
LPGEVVWVAGEEVTQDSGEDVAAAVATLSWNVKTTPL